MTYYYRFQESLYSEFKVMLNLFKFRVINTTTHGVWIDVYGKKKFILISARKRYACPTIEEALESYHARKKRQIRILKYQLAKAEAALRLQKESEITFGDLDI
jgi:hypothetical protein